MPPENPTTEPPAEVSIEVWCEEHRIDRAFCALLMQLHKLKPGHRATPEIFEQLHRATLTARL